jgi:hypothetical protein
MISERDGGRVKRIWETFLGCWVLRDGEDQTQGMLRGVGKGVQWGGVDVCVGWGKA